MKTPDIEAMTRELEEAILQTNRPREQSLSSVIQPEETSVRQPDPEAAVRTPEPMVTSPEPVATDPDLETEEWLGEAEELDEAEELESDEAGISGPNYSRPSSRYPTLIRPKDAYVAAFLVPVLVMIIIFVQRGIFPFGKESFLRTDMYHQYAPFFSEFQYKLTHGGSLLYSWDVGLGVNFSALYAYYLASPFNWLLILCPKKLIIEFMTYMIVVKIGLSGLSMTYYLRKHYGKIRFGAAFFGIFYAMSGYMAAYSWNIMWLDCIILFPLIMLGLERLVKEHRWGLYCVTLGLSILSNYYISIMICIFMVIYFGALVILDWEKGSRHHLISMVQFAGFSLVSGGLAGLVLIPEVLALQSTASGSSTFPKTFTSYFSIIDMIARHLGDVQVEIGLDHWPNIFCGVAVLMFFLLWLACKRIPVREKVVYCSLLLFFYLSFSTNILNFLWHGFHYPNSLPCRQSFIYILLMLSLSYHAYLYLDETPWRRIVQAFWGAAAFVLVAEQIVTEEKFHFMVFYAAILFLALYTGLIYGMKKGWSRNMLVVLGLMVVAIESAVNMTVTSVTSTSRTSYVRDNADVKKLVEESVPHTSFYRIEKVTRKTKNDGAWMNFPSVSLFSSVANADLSKLFKELGCESSTNAYSITGSTPLIDSLLAVRYALYTGAPEDESNLTFLAESGETKLYQNPYVCSLGMGLPQGLEYGLMPESGNPAEIQNRFCDLVGASPVLKDAWGEVNSQSFSFTPETDGEYYVYVINKKVEDVTAVKETENLTFDHVNRGYLLELGWCRAGVQITLNCTQDQILDARAYRFDFNGLGQVYEKLREQEMTVTRWTDTEIGGTVTMKEDGTFFTSIPFDRGWKILVDQKEVTGRTVWDAFLGFELTAGTHEISMKYQPPGLNQGMLLSGGSLAVLAAAAFVSMGMKKSSRSFSRRADRAEELSEEDQK